MQLILNSAYMEKLRQSQPRELLYELRSDYASEWLQKSGRELYDYIIACARRTTSSTIEQIGTYSEQEEEYTDLQMRDLRQLMESTALDEPEITVRRHVVLFNCETIKAIVLVDRMLLFAASYGDAQLRDIEHELSLEHDEIPEFEIRAYEALLKVSLHALARELKAVGE